MLQPHIEKAPLSFPSNYLFKREVQQFLVIISYMANFVPYIAQHMNILSSLLKKELEQWSNFHSQTLQQL